MEGERERQGEEGSMVKESLRHMQSTGVSNVQHGD